MAERIEYKWFDIPQKVISDNVGFDEKDAIKEIQEYKDRLSRFLNELGSKGWRLSQTTVLAHYEATMSMMFRSCPESALFERVVKVRKMGKKKK